MSPPRPYQDVVRAGRIIRGRRTGSSARLAAMQPFLSALRQPFTVLDLGAAEGYFAQRIAEEYGATVLAIDAAKHPDTRVRRGRVVRRVRRITAETLPELGSYDVVLALSVLHHCPDWRVLLPALVTATRAHLFLETPDPAEQLRVAAARAELGELAAAVGAIAPAVLARTPGIYARDLARELRVHAAAPLRWSGVVTAGSGNHGRFSRAFRDAVAPLLGYRMELGSLNVRTALPAVRPLLGAPAIRFYHRRRYHGRMDTVDYLYWPARVGGIACHAMIPGRRVHGPEWIELVAPVHLRTALGLGDGDAVEVVIGAGA